MKIKDQEAKVNAEKQVNKMQEEAIKKKREKIEKKIIKWDADYKDKKFYQPSIKEDFIRMIREPKSR